MNKEILRDLSYGVYVVSSKKEDRDVGCIVNSAMQITSSKTTIAISVNLDNYTNSAIKETGEFVLQVLPEEVDSNILKAFGFQSSREVDKFEEMDFERKDNYPILTCAIGYLPVRVTQIVEVGTHTLFIGEVLSMEKLKEGTPMTYAYYHQVKKGKSPKNAPTYQEEVKESNKKQYVCTICGYVHEGDLPEDFVCPICGVGRELFKEV